MTRIFLGLSGLGIFWTAVGIAGLALLWLGLDEFFTSQIAWVLIGVPIGILLTYFADRPTNHPTRG